jgi:hypothetical protein
VFKDTLRRKRERKVLLGTDEFPSSAVDEYLKRNDAGSISMNVISNFAVLTDKIPDDG